MSQTTRPERNWLKVYGQDPKLILREGVKVSSDVYFEVIGHKVGIRKEDYVRFEGSNGCVAWAFSNIDTPLKTGEDHLGQPLITNASIIIAWNPTIRSYRNQYYDFLAYEASNRKPEEGA